MDGFGGTTTFVIFLVLVAISWAFMFRFAPETKSVPFGGVRLYRAGLVAGKTALLHRVHPALRADDLR
jgi:hypothetical protein